MSIRVELDQLLELQAADSARDSALKSRAQIDDGTRAQAVLTDVQSAWEAAHATLSTASGSLKDAELELASVEKKIADYQGKMNSGKLTNSREIANVEKELHQLNRQRSACDDKILQLMDDADRARSAISGADERLREAQRSLQNQRELARQTLDKLNEQIARLETERSALVTALKDSPLLAKYEAQRKRPATNGLAIARVDSDRHCSGCHLPISQIDAQRVKDAEMLVNCENCGRMLG